MPSKKKGPSETKSKKVIAEEKARRVADQTFGIKNKKNSAKAQKAVQRVKQSITGNEDAARAKHIEEKKAKRLAREQEEQMERALFSEGTDVLKAKKGAAAKPVQSAAEKAEADAAMASALARAKELFDTGAITMQEYVEYKDQIMAADDSSEEEEEEDDDDEDAADDDDATADTADREEEEEEPEEEAPPPDPRSVEELYLEDATLDGVDLDVLPDE